MTLLEHDEVAIVWRSDTALSASVRGAEGIVDVRWTAGGWDCTCPEPYGCAHILAVKAIAMAAS